MSPRRPLSRPQSKRLYRKRFVLAVEGNKTEPQYFAIFNNQDSVIRVKCLKSKHDNDPLRVLARMKAYLKKEKLKKTDEAWLIVDKDQWTDAQLMPLYDWAQKTQNANFALSNPKFEFWLLLHFEDGNRVSNSKICSKRLEHYLPGYNKGINIRTISDTMIAEAVSRAKQRDNPPCARWPSIPGTTVYKLVENILK